MKNKLKIIIPIVIAVIAIIVAALCIDFTPAEKVDIPSLVSTAQKYLIENNYEQAIAEFNKVIELEPKNVDAYIGLAESYVGMDNTEKAIEWLEKGYALTGDERIKNMIDELNSENPVEETAVTIAIETEDTTIENTTETITETTEVVDKEVEAIKKQVIKIIGSFVPDKSIGVPNSEEYTYIKREFLDTRLDGNTYSIKCEYDNMGNISKRIVKYNIDDDYYEVYDYKINKQIHVYDTISYFGLGKTLISPNDEYEDFNYAYCISKNYNEYIFESEQYPCGNTYYIHIINDIISSIDVESWVYAKSGELSYREYMADYKWNFNYDATSLSWTASCGNQNYSLSQNIYYPYNIGFPDGYSINDFGDVPNHSYIYESYDSYLSSIDS